MLHLLLLAGGAYASIDTTGLILHLEAADFPDNGEDAMPDDALWADRVGGYNVEKMRKNDHTNRHDRVYKGDDHLGRPVVRWTNNDSHLKVIGGLPIAAGDGRTLCSMFKVSVSANAGGQQVIFGEHDARGISLGSMGGFSQQMIIRSNWSAYAASPTTITYDDVHYMCVTDDGTKTVVFYDGVKFFESTGARYNYALSNFYIGGNSVMWGRGFMGDIYNVYVWNRAMDETELEATAAALIGDPCVDNGVDCGANGTCSNLQAVCVCQNEYLGHHCEIPGTPGVPSENLILHMDASSFIERSGEDNEWPSEVWGYTFTHYRWSSRRTAVTKGEDADGTFVQFHSTDTHYYVEGGLPVGRDQDRTVCITLKLPAEGTPGFNPNNQLNIFSSDGDGKRVDVHKRGIRLWTNFGDDAEAPEGTLGFDTKHRICFVNNAGHVQVFLDGTVVIDKEDSVSFGWPFQWGGSPKFWLGGNGVYWGRGFFGKIYNFMVWAKPFTAQEVGQLDAPVPVPVDCEVGAWTAYGTCSASCGAGTQTRSRSKTVVEADGGTCDLDLTETQACNDGPCPVNCEVGDWGEWGACSVTCGDEDGTQERSRSKTRDEDHGGSCDLPLTETQACNNGNACPKVLYSGPITTVDQLKDWCSWDVAHCRVCKGKDQSGGCKIKVKKTAKCGRFKKKLDVCARINGCKVKEGKTRRNGKKTKAKCKGKAKLD